MNNYIQAGNSVLNAQPFSQFLGARLENLDKGLAEISLTLRKEFQQSNGFIHGGVISYMADNCLTFAGATILGHVVTSEFKINYLHPAVGEKLIAKSSVISSGFYQAVSECRVYVETGDKNLLVAAAQGTVVKIKVESKSEST